MKKKNKQEPMITADLLEGADSVAFPTYIKTIGANLQHKYDFLKEHLNGKTGQTYQIKLRETLIKSHSSFPRRREPSLINKLDPRLRGDDDLFSAFLILLYHKLRSE